MVGDLDLPGAHRRRAHRPRGRRPRAVLRNRYLAPTEREAALTLSRALRSGAAAAGDGPDAVRAAARAVLAEAAGRGRRLPRARRPGDVHPRRLRARRPGPARGRGPGRHHPADRQRRGLAVSAAGWSALRDRPPAPAARPAAGRAARLVAVGRRRRGRLRCRRPDRGPARPPRPAPVLLVTKALLDAGSTRWAQGGIAAALGPGDTPGAARARHPGRRRRALRRPRRSASLVNEGPGAVRRLIALGAALRPRPPTAPSRSPARAATSATASPTPAATPPARRSPARCVAAVQADPGIEVVEHALVLDLLRSADGAVAGAHPARDGRGAERTASARCSRRAVVLATGGMGQVFAQTTNPSVSTGDGVAAGDARRGAGRRPGVRAVPPHRAVARAGRPRPAAADLRGGPRRGRVPRRRRRGALHAGAAPAGRPRAARRRRQGDHARGCARPAPRTCGSTAGTSARDRWEQRFPTILRVLRRPAASTRCVDLIPVAPACHYASGGVRTDLRRPHQRSRPVRLRRGRLHRRARRQPAGVQLPARGAGLRRAHRARRWQAGLPAEPAGGRSPAAAAGLVAAEARRAVAADDGRGRRRAAVAGLPAGHRSASWPTLAGQRRAPTPAPSAGRPPTCSRSRPRWPTSALARAGDPRIALARGLPRARRRALAAYGSTRRLVDGEVTARPRRTLR